MTKVALCEWLIHPGCTSPFFKGVCVGGGGRTLPRVALQHLLSTRLPLALDNLSAIAAKHGYFPQSNMMNDGFFLLLLSLCQGLQAPPQSTIVERSYAIMLSDPKLAEQLLFNFLTFYLGPFFFSRSFTMRIVHNIFCNFHNS